MNFRDWHVDVWAKVAADGGVSGVTLVEGGHSVSVSVLGPRRAHPRTACSAQHSVGCVAT